ncbi:MAG: Ldh family oxidoreductase [Verrucomicrobia bacterium]|nr:Ldh family oxidoreductase [Verrucomicrobiota bacterium]
MDDVSKTVRISVKELTEVCIKAVSTLGYTSDEAGNLVDCMLAAQLRGNSQGIIKITTGGLNKHPEESSVKIVHETPVSARIDGGRCLGMSVLVKAIKIAAEKAGTSGISLVTTSNTPNSTGYLGWYAKQLAKENLIGIVLAQSPEFVAPYGAYQPIFGTNPIAISVPGSGDSEPVTLDMATSAYALFGLLEAKTAGISIPDNVAYDSEGEPTTDPAAALAGAIRVFDRSHKSSGLALMVELLAGALSGSAIENKRASACWGNLVLAIDPKIIWGDDPGLEAFRERVNTVCQRVKSAKKLPGVEGILLPGERGDRVAANCVSADSIEIETNLYNELCRMAEV